MMRGTGPRLNDEAFAVPHAAGPGEVLARSGVRGRVLFDIGSTFVSQGGRLTGKGSKIARDKEVRVITQLGIPAVAASDTSAGA
jgi:hypothetical protein